MNVPIGQGIANAKAISHLKYDKRAAWEYIKTIPECYHAGCISAVKLTLKTTEVE